jgi:hypothetical protein
MKRLFPKKRSSKRSINRNPENKMINTAKPSSNS